MAGRRAGRGSALGAALVAPWLAGAATVPIRDHLARTNAALVLVLVVVAVAALGHRPAGPIAALSAGACFDFLFTRPYQSFTIEARDDLETTLLLVLVGVLVGELAVWGHRQQARSARSRGYLDGIREALGSVAADVPALVLVERVRAQLTCVLDLDGCRFDQGPPADDARRHPLLRTDGEIEVDGAVCDIRHFGMPRAHDIELPVGRGAGQVGRFWLVAGAGARPTLEERLVAVALADRAASVITQAGHTR